MFPPLTRSCQLPESLVSFGLCLAVSELLLLAFSGLLVLKGALRLSLCSGGFESLRAGGQAVVFMTDLVPGGKDREERMQSSIGNNLGSTNEKIHR